MTPLTSYWLTFDYLSFDVAVPTTTVAGSSLASTGPAPGSETLSAISGAGTQSGLEGALSQGIVRVDDEDYLTLTFMRPEPVVDGSQYVVESGGDMVHWESGAIEPVSSHVEAGVRTITVRDVVPISESPGRFMRVLRLGAESDDAGGGVEFSVELPGPVAEAF